MKYLIEARVVGRYGELARSIGHFGGMSLIGADGSRRLKLNGSGSGRSHGHDPN